MIINGADIALIVGSFLTALGGVIIAIISNKRAVTANHKKDQVEAEMGIGKRSIDFAGFVGRWSKLHKKVSSLIEDTEIDRFLLLRAWNGASSPKWTTAVLQIREADQEPVSYVHFELDPDYVNRLKEVTINGSAYYVVEDLPDVSIKEVYQYEGVVATLWVMLDKQEFPDGTARITYVSYSTHDSKGISKKTQIACKLNADEIKGIVNHFYND